MSSALLWLSTLFVLWDAGGCEGGYAILRKYPWWVLWMDGESAIFGTWRVMDEMLMEIDYYTKIIYLCRLI